MALLNAFIQPNDDGYFFKAMMNGIDPDYMGREQLLCRYPRPRAGKSIPLGKRSDWPESLGQKENAPRVNDGAVRRGQVNSDEC